MDNTLKCRVWDKTTMHYDDFVITATGYIAKLKTNDNQIMSFDQCDLNFDNSVTTMKCTGLTDKHNNLIYEGDILKETYVWNDETESDITVVEWIKSGAVFVMQHIGHKYDYTYFDEADVNLNNFEIIGNKYESPELLKGNKNE